MHIFSSFDKAKNDKLSEYTPMILITVLLICQIIVSYYLSFRQNIENHYTRVSQVMRVQQASEDNHQNVSATLAATIISDPEILKLTENASNVNTHFEISKRLRKYMATAEAIDNIYLYKHTGSYIFDANTNKSCNGSISPSHNIVFDCIKQYQETGKTDFYYSLPLTNHGTKYLYKIYIGSNTAEDLIIIRENFSELSRAYLDISYDLKSEIAIANSDGNVIFGDTTLDILSYLDENELYRLKHNGSYYKSIVLNNKQYFAVYTYSPTSERYYFMFTPEAVVVRDGFSNRSYIYTYICIILSLLTLIRVFSLWKKLRIKLIYPHAKQHIAEPKISLHAYLAEDSDGSTSLLLSHINEKFPDAQLATVLLIKIDNSAELREIYSQSDFDLIKYGTDNICAEIFTNHGFGVINTTDSEDVLEYIITRNTSEQFERECMCAAKECMTSLNRYIHMNTSYFAASPLSLRDIHSCYENALQIFEYSFIRGSNSILTTNDIKSASPEDFIMAKQLCDTIKQSIIENSAGYEDNLQRLKAITKIMNPSQIREILYNLIISMYSAVEYLEHKLNVLVIFDVSSCFTALEKAQFSDEIFKLADNLYDDVALQLSDRDKLQNSPFVADCMKIIKENYSDENLCLEEIARRMSFSSNYLGRKFKQLTGSSIATMITEIRLDAAANEIVTTNDKIQDIIKRVGISNSSHFTALFRKRFGESPVNYRHTHKRK